MRGFLLVLLLALTLFLSCSKNKPKEVEYPVSDFLSSCSFNYRGEIIDIIDSANNIKISFPIGWDTEKVNDAGFKGIYSMDTSSFLNMNLIHTLQINSVKTNNPLKSHFISELRGLENDSIPIIEIGAINFNDRPAHWVMTTRNTEEGNFKDLLLYTKGSVSGQILIIHLSINDGEDFRKRFCQLKSIINSIAFLEKTSINLTNFQFNENHKGCYKVDHYSQVS